MQTCILPRVGKPTTRDKTHEGRVLDARRAFCDLSIGQIEAKTAGLVYGKLWTRVVFGDKPLKDLDNGQLLALAKVLEWTPSQLQEHTGAALGFDSSSFSQRTTPENGLTEPPKSTPIYASLFDALASQEQAMKPIGAHHKNLGMNIVIARITESDACEVTNSVGFPANDLKPNDHIRIDLDIPEFEAFAPAYIDLKSLTAFIASAPIKGRSLILRPYGTNPVYSSTSNAWQYVGDVIGQEWLRQ
jgi:hypothetical protein